MAIYWEYIYVYSPTHTTLMVKDIFTNSPHVTVIHSIHNAANIILKQMLIAYLMLH